MTRQAISLRRASEDDYDFLFALHRASMRDYVDAVWGWDDQFQSVFFREHFEPARLRIIEVDGDAIGVIGFDEDAERLDIGLIEVDPTVQGRGIGSAALGEMFAIADAAGIPATLQVLKVNSRALRLYERVGFEVVGETDTHFLMRRPVNGTAES